MLGYRRGGHVRVRGVRVGTGNEGQLGKTTLPTQVGEFGSRRSGGRSSGGIGGIIIAGMNMGISGWVHKVRQFGSQGRNFGGQHMDAMRIFWARLTSTASASTTGGTTGA
jgi:hypothetical protein